MKVKQRMKGLDIKIIDGKPSVEPVYETYFDDSNFKKVIKSKGFQSDLFVLFVWLTLSIFNYHFLNFKTGYIDCIVIGFQLHRILLSIQQVIKHDKMENPTIKSIDLTQKDIDL